MNTAIAALRREYRNSPFHKSDAAADPFSQFKVWFDQALEADVADPTAMVLATASPAGAPSARVVLLKGFDAEGFSFFTNYESRKAEELARNPQAALVFWWHELDRQVRIEGAVERTAPEASEAYFESRPRGSQLGAWASPQSRVLQGRAALEARLAEVEARFAEAPIPRPPYWGGFRVVPHAVEFWQGRPSRLHDRLRYRRDDQGAWHCERLAP